MFPNFFTPKNLIKHFVKNKNELFTLWISDYQELPELQQLSLKSMLLTGHKVILYTYGKLKNVPEGVEIANAHKILDKSNIFKYKQGFNKGSYSGFSNWFRTKYLYENGGNWFDCDVLAIKNINEVNNNDTIIPSQNNPDGEIWPTNGFLRFEKNDKLLKDSLDHIEKVRDNVKHGETGPNLLKLMMDSHYIGYYDYLTSTDFIAPINYYDYKDFLKPSKEIVKKFKFDEIWGFHVWNAMFRNSGMIHEKADSGFYFDLKEAIFTSTTKDEYQEKINKIIQYKN